MNSLITKKESPNTKDDLLLSIVDNLEKISSNLEKISSNLEKISSEGITVKEKRDFSLSDWRVIQSKRISKAVEKIDEIINKDYHNDITPSEYIPVIVGKSSSDLIPFQKEKVEFLNEIKNILLDIHNT